MNMVSGLLIWCMPHIARQSGGGGGEGVQLEKTEKKLGSIYFVYCSDSDLNSCLLSIQSKLCFLKSKSFAKHTMPVTEACSSSSLQRCLPLPSATNPGPLGKFGVFS